MAETRVVITAEAEQAIREFDRLRTSATGSLQQLGAAGDQMSRTTVSAAQTAAALRQVPAQFTDIVVSLQAGQAPITVLLQQGGQLRDMFGSTSGAARALGGYVLGLINPLTLAIAASGALGYAFYEGNKESQAFSKSLILSGNVAGVTSGQLADMAKNISKTVGTQSEASAVLAELAGSGKVSVENLQNFARVAVTAQKAGSKSAGDMVKDFNELGKSPVEASAKLNEQYHYLTAATQAQIKALQDQGRQEEAAELAQKTYASAMDKRNSDIIASLGYVQRAWNAAGEMAKSAWDKFINIGRKDTSKDIISGAQVEIDRLRSQLPIATDLDRVSPRGGKRNQDAIQRQIDAQQKLIDIETKKSEIEVWNAKAKADSAKLEEATTNWQQEGLKYLSKEEQLRKELLRQREMGLAAGLSDVAINSRLAAVRKSFGDLNNASLASLEASRALEHEVLAGKLADLESQHKQGLISDVAYVAAKRDIQLQELDGEKGIIQKQIELAGGKSDLSERNKYLGSLAVLEQRRRNLIKESENAIGEITSASAKAIKAQSTAWQAASISEQQQLEDEISLFGKSAEARAIAVAQIKVDADSRKLLADWERQGHAFTAQEVADLNAAATARKASIATIMGEQQARAGAEQLRQENKKFLVDSIVDEKQRATGLLAIDAELWRQRIGLAAAGSDAQKMLQTEFDVWYANRQMAPVIDRWKGVISNLDNNFQQGFRDMLTSGKGAWKSFSTSIGNTLKTSLADALYQTFIKKYVVQIVAGMAGVLSGGNVAAALMGNTAEGAAGSGLASGLGLAGMGAAFGSSAMAGLTAAWGAGGSLAATLSTAVAGATAAPMASLGLAMGALAPVAIGLGAAIAYWKSKDTSGTYHTGGGASASAAGVSTIRAESLNFQGTQTSAETEKFVAGLASGIVSILDTTALAFGKTAGYTAATAFADDTSKDGAWGGLVIEKLGSKILDWQDTRTSRWAPKEFADGAAGQAEYLAALGGSVRTALDGIGLPSWAGTMLDALGSAPSIETLTSTVQTIVATEKALSVLGDKISGFAGLSDDAASALMAASGGIETLTTNASSYYENFYSAGEKASATTKQVADALAAVGVIMPTTREAYRAELEAKLALGESGAKAAAVMFSMNAAFASVVKETEQAAEQATNYATGLSDAKSALADAYASESDAIKATIESTRNYVTSLMGLRDSMLLGDLSPLTPQQKYQEAAKQYDATRAAAMAGDTTAQGKLQSAMTAFLTASRTVNASNDQYQSDFAKTQADLTIAIASGKSQISTAEASLIALNKQVTGLVTVNNSVLSVGAAIAQLATAMGADGAAIVAASSGDAISSLYQSLLGRAPDAAGLAYWTAALSKGGSIAGISSSIGSSSEYQALHSHANGLDYVPFNGYPAKLHAGEGVLTAAENLNYRSMGAGANIALVSEIKALRAELSQLRADQSQQTAALITSNLQATAQAADKVVDATVSSADAAAYANRTQPVLV